jgi:hypothetical protein
LNLNVNVSPVTLLVLLGRVLSQLDVLFFQSGPEVLIRWSLAVTLEFVDRAEDDCGATEGCAAELDGWLAGGGGLEGGGAEVEGCGGGGGADGGGGGGGGADDGGGGGGGGGADDGGGGGGGGGDVGGGGGGVDGVG